MRHRTHPATVAALLLLVACTHEFAWQAWPADQQGDVRNVTQWLLLAALCACVAERAARVVVAACAAVALMSFTTAACSALWLYAPWPVVPGADQCSARLGLPMLSLSGLAAVLVLFLWRPPHHGTQPR